MALKRSNRDFYYCDCGGNVPDERGNVRENVSYDLKNKTITCKDCGTVYQEKPHTGRCFRCGREFQKYAWHTPSGCNKCCMSFVE